MQAHVFIMPDASRLVINAFREDVAKLQAELGALAAGLEAEIATLEATLHGHPVCERCSEDDKPALFRLNMDRPANHLPLCCPADPRVEIWGGLG